MIKFYFLIVFIFISTFSFSQQKVTLNVEDETVLKVLDEVKYQTNYHFIFNHNLIDVERKISITAINEDVALFLIRLFDGTNVLVSFVDEQIILHTKNQTVNFNNASVKMEGITSQVGDSTHSKDSIYLKNELLNKKKIVKGVLFTINNEPLFGVSVTVKDFNIQVFSNNKGEFEIIVPKNTVEIIFKLEGFETKSVVIEGETNLEVMMVEPSEKLKELVITGYQKISRESATGAYDVIPSVEIKNNANQNIGSVLQGIAPGIEIIEDADGNINLNNVVIRGIGSIDPGSSTTPLLVVDGFPVNGGFNTINPNDVASITILKDAAAASIWGARAGNGVIVIETKKGGSTKGIQVEFNTFVKIRSKIDLEKNISRADAETTLALESTLWTPLGHGVNSPFMYNYPPPQTLYDNVLVSRGGNTNYSHGARAYYDAYVGNITNAELDATINRLEGINNYEGIDKYLLASPIQQTYNLAIIISGEKSATRFSAVYNNNQNAFIKDINNQLLININNQYKIKDWLSLNLVAMLDNSKDSNSGINFEMIQNMNPYERLVNDDRSYASVKGIYDAKYMEYFGDNMTNLPYEDLTYNPLRDANDSEFKAQQTNFRINAALTIDIIDGLKFRPSIQYEKFQTKYNNYYGAETSPVLYSVINGTDRFEYDPSKGTIGELHIPTGAQLTNSNSESKSTIFRSVLTYDKKINKHDFSVFTGVEASSSTTYNIENPRTYGFNKENNTTQRPDDSSWTPLWDQVASVNDSTYYGQSDRRYISYFGNASYTYNNKYIVFGSVRSDGANFIVTDKSMRFNPMWSAGLSWNAKNEKFLTNIDAIENLRLRITNGTNGNLVGTVSTEPTISLDTEPDYYTGQWNAYLISLGNPTLRWEKINTLNFGLDFSVFDRSLYGSIDVYNKRSEDLIATVSLASTIGQSRGTFNVGEMTNKGIELNLASDINFNNGVMWTTNLVFSNNKSKVTSLSTDYLNPFWMASTPYVEGRPYQPIYAFEYGGMQKIDSQDELYPTVIAQENNEVIGMDAFMTGDGRDQLKYMGTAVAPTILGWNNTVMFKNFSLSARVLGNFGHKFRRPTYAYSAFLQGGNYHEDLKGLMAGNHDVMGLPQIPLQWDYFTYRWDNYISNLDTLVEDASHIRLKQIYLSYDFSQELLSSTGIKGLRIFMQAENLGNIWTANSYNIDPEYIRGVNRRPEKTFSFGFDFKF